MEPLDPVHRGTGEVATARAVLLVEPGEPVGDLHHPVPVGPPLIWIPAALLLLSEGHTAWAIFIFAWGAVVVSSVDNFVKPMIISRGSALPFVLVLLGVLGGAVAFGFVGVFLGPVLLAVGYALLKEWAVDSQRLPDAVTSTRGNSD